PTPGNRSGTSASRRVIPAPRAASSATPGRSHRGRHAPPSACSGPRARSEAGDQRVADRIWRELGEGYPRYLGSSLMARAELLLSEGDPQGALSLYEAAIAELSDPHVVAVARLGSAACLERLGDLDGALAAIEYGDLPADVLHARRQGLRTRSAMSNGDL